MLSNIGIHQALESGDLKFTPMPEPEAFQPASVDLRINLQDVVERISGTYMLEGGVLVLEPNALVLASTIEHIALSALLGARVEGKSSWGRMGLQAHVTAGFIDPGFRGPITLELKNLTYGPIAIKHAVYISQVCFFAVQPPLLPDMGYSGAYQDATGTQRSKFEHGR